MTGNHQFHGTQLAHTLMTVTPIIEIVSHEDDKDRRVQVVNSLTATIASAVNALDMTQNEVIHALLAIAAGTLVLPENGEVDSDNVEMIHHAFEDYVAMMTQVAKNGGAPRAPTIN
ncbi:hypothetical protein EVB27_116 [Rhizobium phage RHph_TM16]|nr:hypothetical protein EVB27_116 [Rhizobium phage RHph_TM16]